MLKGKIIVITGGASGIGLALIDALIANNTIISLDRNPTKIQALQERHPKVVCIPTDLTDLHQLQAAIDTIQQQYQYIDILINNAGIAKVLDWQTMDAETMLAVYTAEWQTNFIAPLHLAKISLPLLQQASNPTIVMITSGLIYAPKIDLPNYSATKTALHSMCLTMRAQLPEVKIIEVLPPMVDTSMNTDTKGKKMSPEQFAHDCLKGISKGQERINVGMSKMLGIISRIAPRLAMKLVNA